MMATLNVGSVVQDLKTRIGAIATAVVSRDGLVLYAAVPTGVCAETFAIMCATIFGAASTASTELNRAPPEAIVIEGSDSKTIIAGCRKTGLLVAVVDHRADLTRVLREAAKFAGLLMAN